MKIYITFSTTFTVKLIMKDKDLSNDVLNSQVLKEKQVLKISAAMCQ